MDDDAKTFLLVVIASLIAVAILVTCEVKNGNIRSVEEIEQEALYCRQKCHPYAVSRIDGNQCLCDKTKEWKE